MSLYAFDPDLRQLMVGWPTVVGSRAQLVTRLAPAVPAADADLMCAGLSRLSQALWDTYVRPASATNDDQERSRREHERQSLTDVIGAVRQPNLPDAAGVLVVSHSPVEESANQLGRLLHRIGDTVLLERVVADVQVELDAVTQAELGDLSGRAVQAVALDRLDVSPVQVAAAAEQLRADPCGGRLLSTALDPAAACVAGAHWLVAAAMVAADAAGTTPVGVFAQADDIQAVSVKVPTHVVAKIVETGLAPQQVVLGLLRTAVAAGEGVIADLPAVLAARARLEQTVQQLPADLREQTLARELVRSTMLDPRRPARDLLEHLVDGLASCQLLYTEYAPETDPDLDAGEDADDDDLEVDVQRREEIAAEFAEAVREQAAATRQRLH